MGSVIAYYIRQV